MVDTSGLLEEVFGREGVAVFGRIQSAYKAYRGVELKMRSWSALTLCITILVAFAGGSDYSASEFMGFVGRAPQPFKALLLLVLVVLPALAAWGAGWLYYCREPDALRQEFFRILESDEGRSVARIFAISTTVANSTGHADQEGFRQHLAKAAGL